MAVEKREELVWIQWRDILLAEYEGRLAAIGTKDYLIVPARKTFAAIFLQVKDFSVPVADILPEAIRIIKEKDAFPPDSSSLAKEYNDIAMMGHHIGMLENSAGLKQYLQDISPSLKPEGQILLTAFDVPTVNGEEHPSTPVLSILQLQQANLIGPFFAMLRIKADTLKSQAAVANWKCEFIYHQDDSNYCVRLSLSESG